MAHQGSQLVRGELQVVAGGSDIGVAHVHLQLPEVLGRLHVGPHLVDRKGVTEMVGMQPFPAHVLNAYALSEPADQLKHVLPAYGEQSLPFHRFL